MALAKYSCFCVTALALMAGLLSCSSEMKNTVPHVKPATTQATIILDESRLPKACEVFTHLLIGIPARYDGADIKGQIEDFGRKHGASHILLGMVRESEEAPDTIVFHTYGPENPYSYDKQWVGWKYGFSDWNSEGPLVDYGMDRLSSAETAFELPVTAQAVLLSCQAENP